MGSRNGKKIVLGVIVGNRDFFPDHLAASGRAEILELLAREQIEAVIIEEHLAKHGAIETHEEAERCAELFRKERERIDGVLITLPNFGDEKAIAHAIRKAGLTVPVLVHAYKDDLASMSIRDRRDSFCGKMSLCNNLQQYGIKYTLTSEHTMDPQEEAFLRDLRKFVSTCAVVRALRQARLGSIGARPASFNTVRYSERLLEQSGISVETIDLSEIFGRIERLKSGETEVKAKLDDIRAYVSIDGLPADKLEKMAKLGVVIDRWMREQHLHATAVQCWTSMQQYFGIVPCTLMSMMSSGLLPSACEVDVPGLVGMYALQEASGKPSALLDWNNNYGDDPDKGVVFHCSNLPKEMFEAIHMDYHEILSGTVGRENTLGTLQGRIKPSAFTYCKVATDDVNGRIAAYVGEGAFTGDPLLTFGGYGVVQVPRFQQLLAYICEQGFEHHVAMNLSTVGGAVQEAFTKYMGWDVYHHRQ